MPSQAALNRRPPPPPTIEEENMRNRLDTPSQRKKITSRYPNLKKSQNTRPQQQDTKPVYPNVKPAHQDAKPVYQENKPIYQNAKPQHQDTIPVQRDTKPVYRDTKPLIQDTKPVYKDAKLVYRDTKPVYQDSKPVYRDTKPVYQDTKPVYKDTKPVYRDTKPVYQNNKPVYQDTKPVNLEPKPVYQERNAVYQDTKPMYQDTKPVYQEPKPVYQDTKPVYQDTKSVYQEPKPVYQDTKPVYQDTKSVYQEPKPVYQDTKPVYQDTKPVYQDTKSVYQEPKPVYQETKPVYQEPRQVYQDTKPVYQDAKSPYQDTKPVYQDQSNRYPEAVLKPSQPRSHQPESRYLRMQSDPQQIIDPSTQHSADNYNKPTANTAIRHHPDFPHPRTPKPIARPVQVVQEAQIEAPVLKVQIVKPEPISKGHPEPTHRQQLTPEYPQIAPVDKSHATVAQKPVGNRHYQAPEVPQKSANNKASLDLGTLLGDPNAQHHHSHGPTDHHHAMEHTHSTIEHEHTGNPNTNIDVPVEPVITVKAKPPKRLKPPPTQTTQPKPNPQTGNQDFMSMFDAWYKSKFDPVTTQPSPVTTVPTPYVKEPLYRPRIFTGRPVKLIPVIPNPNAVVKGDNIREMILRSKGALPKPGRKIPKRQEPKPKSTTVPPTVPSTVPPTRKRPKLFRQPQDISQLPAAGSGARAVDKQALFQEFMLMYKNQFPGAGSEPSTRGTKIATVTDKSTRAAPVTDKSTKSAPVTDKSTKSAPVTDKSTKSAPITVQSTKSAPITVQSTKAAPVTVKSTKSAPVTQQSSKQVTNVTVPQTTKVPGTTALDHIQLVTLSHPETFAPVHPETPAPIPPASVPAAEGHPPPAETPPHTAGHGETTNGESAPHAAPEGAAAAEVAPAPEGAPASGEAAQPENPPAPAVAPPAPVRTPRPKPTPRTTTARPLIDPDTLADINEARMAQGLPLVSAHQVDLQGNLLPFYNRQMRIGRLPARAHPFHHRQGRPHPLHNPVLNTLTSMFQARPPHGNNEGDMMQRPPHPLGRPRPQRGPAKYRLFNPVPPGNNMQGPSGLDNVLSALTAHNSGFNNGLSGLNAPNSGFDNGLSGLKAPNSGFDNGLSGLTAPNNQVLDSLDFHHQNIHMETGNNMSPDVHRTLHRLLLQRQRNAQRNSLFVGMQNPTPARRPIIDPDLMSDLMDAAASNPGGFVG